MAIQSLLVLYQFPMLLSVFVLLELWYFIYTNLCPFLDRIPYFRSLNPCNACLRIGFHLLPLARFLAVPSDGDPAALGERDPFAGEEKDEDFNVDWLFRDDEINVEKNTSKLSEDGNLVEGLSRSRRHSINIYKAIPFRFSSRLWGQVNSVDVPHLLRKPIYGLYARLFNCNLAEALVEDLTWYQNLSAFFRRELKPGVRPLAQSKSLVSPCDGKVLHFGNVEKGWMEQVKGVTYTLQGFLGPNINGLDGETKAIPDNEYQACITTKPGNRLYQCIIYLAPGDYHRFHSPTDWTIKHRRHFPGLLFSVNPGIARWIRGLFSMNERVVLHGEWEHGFFSMTAVGATNVGSIGIYFDEELRTNIMGRFKQGEYYDRRYTTAPNNTTKTSKGNNKDHPSSGVQVSKGEGIGEFNLGSTIVLIFEAPKDFEFSFRPGDKVRLNEGISSL